MGNTQHHAAALDVQREVADMNRDAAHLEKKTSRDEIHSGDGNGNKNSANSGNSSGNGNGSIRMLPQAMTPSRITRNVTHTTHATYDDSASLSTCATNPVLINKASFSNDANSQTLTHPLYKLSTNYFHYRTPLGKSSTFQTNWHLV